MPTAIGTAYGEPWDSMEGGGTTSTGVKLGDGKQRYVVAVNPNIIPYGTKLKIPHNPFGNPSIVFTAADTGGAFHSSNKIDFYIADTKKEGNHNRLFKWGEQRINYTVVGKGSPHDFQSAGEAANAVIAGTTPKAAGKSYLTKTTTTPASTDTSSAIVDSLLNSSGKLPHIGGGHGGYGLLGDIMHRLSSGAYDTAATTATTKTPVATGQVGGKTAAVPPGAVPVAGGGYAFPVNGHFTENRTDRGVDLETTPGSKLAAIASGTIVNLNGAFPGGSIILKLDKPIGGYQYVFYGHLNGNKKVRVGQRVRAGETVALSAQNPTGAENMPGHVEIGFVNNPGGSIESAHDNTHNTHSGNTFHTFLSSHFPGRVSKNPIIG